MSGAYQQFTRTNQARPYFAEGTAPMLALESMVDAVGLRNVLSALVLVCHAKANHVGEAWQDKRLAADWNRAAEKIDRCAWSGQMPDPLSD